ncbi:MAG: hypothetical protein WCK42_02535 [Myxococcaceae bacterium]
MKIFFFCIITIVFFSKPPMAYASDGKLAYNLESISAIALPAAAITLVVASIARLVGFSKSGSLAVGSMTATGILSIFFGVLFAAAGPH